MSVSIANCVIARSGALYKIKISAIEYPTTPMETIDANLDFARTVKAAARITIIPIIISAKDGEKGMFVSAISLVENRVKPASPIVVKMIVIT